MLNPKLILINTVTSFFYFDTKPDGTLNFSTRASREHLNTSIISASSMYQLEWKTKQ